MISLSVKAHKKHQSRHQDITRWSCPYPHFLSACKHASEQSQAQTRNLLIVLSSIHPVRVQSCGQPQIIWPDIIWPPHDFSGINRAVFAFKIWIGTNRDGNLFQSLRDLKALQALDLEAKLAPSLGSYPKRWSLRCPSRSGFWQPSPVIKSFLYLVKLAYRLYFGQVKSGLSGWSSVTVGNKNGVYFLTS